MDCHGSWGNRCIDISAFSRCHVAENKIAIIMSTKKPHFRSSGRFSCAHCVNVRARECFIFDFTFHGNGVRVCSRYSYIRCESVSVRGARTSPPSYTSLTKANAEIWISCRHTIQQQNYIQIKCYNSIFQFEHVKAGTPTRIETSQPTNQRQNDFPMIKCVRGGHGNIALIGN